MRKNYIFGFAIIFLTLTLFNIPKVAEARTYSDNSKIEVQNNIEWDVYHLASALVLRSHLPEEKIFQYLEQNIYWQRLSNTLSDKKFNTLKDLVYMRVETGTLEKWAFHKLSEAPLTWQINSEFYSYWGVYLVSQRVFELEDIISR